MRYDLLRNLVFGSFLAGSMLVFGDELKPALMLQFQDGSQIAYFLETRPVLSFDNQSLHVVSGNVTMDYPIIQVKKHTFEQVSSTSVTELPSGVVRIEGNKVFFSGFTSGQKIAAYASDGRQVAVLEIGPDGNGELSLQALPAGLYVIRYGVSTLKMMKK